MKKFIPIAILGLILLVAALNLRFNFLVPERGAARSVDDPTQPYQQPEEAGFSEEDLEVIRGQFEGLQTTESGMKYRILREGAGEKPSRGTDVTAHYRGTFLDGTQFDSSYDRGHPFTFRAGTGRVIAGWDEAVLDMRKGEKRLIVVPYELAYGERGRPPAIPARSTLVFEIELLDF